MENFFINVGEIFREAGTAFNKLSEMTMLLHPVEDSQPGGKWTDEEIEMLRGCVHRFSVELNKLSLHIKSRTASQIRTTLRKKAFEDAGIPVRQCSTSSFVANEAQSEDSFDSLSCSDGDDDSSPVSKVAIYDYALRTENNSNSRKRVRVNQAPARNEVAQPEQSVNDEIFVRTLNRRKTKFANKAIRYNRRKKRLISQMKNRIRSVTLNMLNASESEVDVEGLGGDVKLEFEGSTDEIST